MNLAGDRFIHRREGWGVAHLTLLVFLLGGLPASAATRYVSLSGGHVSPFTNWVTAAANIQAAIDVSADGDTVWVTNGVYQTGGIKGYPVVTNALTNRVVIHKPITVRSVNGPQVTVIKGRYHSATVTNGNAAVRCVYMTNGASLIGFTLTNGATRAVGSTNEMCGGGVWSLCDDVVISNCVISGNSAYKLGGGAAYGTLNNCTLQGNTATSTGGGAFGSTLYNCTLTENSAVWGGGAGYSTLNGCTLTSNSASAGGGVCGGTLYNCTLTENSARGFGGGVYGATQYNCTLTENSAGNSGGGVYGGTLNNCTLFGNSTSNSGGGAFRSTLNNCTLTGNSAEFLGGGVCTGTLNNCIVYYNTANEGANYYGVTFTNCCTTPHPGGVGNLTNEPSIVSVRNPWLVEASACRDAGRNVVVSWALDVDGEPRTNGAAVDIGSDEYWTAGITGALTASILVEFTNVTVGYAVEFRTDIGGRAQGYTWALGDGTYEENRCVLRHAFATAGVYEVVLVVSNFTDHASATAAVQVVSVESATHYVAPGGGHIVPFTNWITAATNIQDAVDVCVPGGIVWVSNGVYETGGVAGYPASKHLLTNRVAIYKPITVRSVGGPEVTAIRGAGPKGNAAVRCVYMTNGSMLVGFTLTNGATRTSGDALRELCGGGVWCQSIDTLISNCVIIGNSASNFGGGAFYGTLYNCSLSSNTAEWGGGAYEATLYNCTLTRNSAYYGGGASGSTLNNCTLSSNTATWGGGAYKATLYNCTLTRNSATLFGGGTSGGTLYNCTLSRNSASSYGGGGYGGALYNCTLSRNSSSSWGGGMFGGALYNCTLIDNSAVQGGGVYGGSLYNCTVTSNSASSSGGGVYLCNARSSIIYYNTGPSPWQNYYEGNLSYSCLTPDPGETAYTFANITNAPSFVNLSATNLRLRADSPCIDAGQNQAWMTGSTDLDGSPRVFNGRVDMGTYEFTIATAAKALLEGPYDAVSNRMRRAVTVPAVSPYCEDPRLAETIPTNAVDWALIQLMDTNRHAVAVANSVFVTQDGTLVTDDGSPGLRLECSPNHSYYVVVKHRNHLSAISVLPVAFTNTSVSYDFTADTNGAVELEPGVWGLAAGDADGEGRVTPTDV
ncbi:MAG: choice-of-anchor Q domain-containing protein, partial [bacterium]